MYDFNAGSIVWILENMGVKFVPEDLSLFSLRRQMKFFFDKRSRNLACELFACNI
jgi:hypothetical protein